MFFRTPRFIRRWFRNRMHPMAEHKAMDKRQKLSIIYALIAWQAGGYVLYQIMTGNKSWPTTEGIRSKDEDMVRPAIRFAHSLGIDNAEVVRIGRNFSVSEREEFTVDLEKPLEGQDVVVGPSQHESPFLLK